MTTTSPAARSAAAATSTTSANEADASASTPETSPQNCASDLTVSAGDSFAPNGPSAPCFDFGADEQTNTLLLQDAQTFITGNMARIMAAKHAHDLCANNKNGTWGKWCNVVGISRDTGDNMVHIAEQFGNIQIDGQSIFDVRPMKLLYAAAKPSTPEAVKQAVFSGDITTYKEYQDVMAQLKLSDKRADDLQAHNDKLTHDYNDEFVKRRQAELDRDEARARLKNACIQEQNSREAMQAAENARDAALADVKGLSEQNNKLRAENNDLKKGKPIAAVVDEEEVDKRAGEKAYQMAADMTEELRQNNAALQQQLTDTQTSAFETAQTLLFSLENAMSMARPSLLRMVGTGDPLNKVANALVQFCDRTREEAVKLMIQNDKEANEA